MPTIYESETQPRKWDWAVTLAESVKRSKVARAVSKLLFAPEQAVVQAPAAESAGLVPSMRWVPETGRMRFETGEEHTQRRQEIVRMDPHASSVEIANYAYSGNLPDRLARPRVRVASGPAPDVMSQAHVTYRVPDYVQVRPLGQPERLPAQEPTVYAGRPVLVRANLRAIELGPVHPGAIPTGHIELAL